MSAPDAPHYPVMLNEVVAGLRPASGDIIVDGTFGAGGYTRAILSAADCTVLAIDQDKTALARGQMIAQDFPGRLHLLHGNFAQSQNLAMDAGFRAVDGFVLDLGVSSTQLDEAERGFSFRFDGPLDMRMDQSANIETAADIVNHYEESALADIFYYYGEERHARKIARAIIAARGRGELFERTLQLADLIRGSVPKSHKDKIDPATRAFQGLRIFVNRELDVLCDALLAAERLLKDGGRLVIVSFHSLEDRLVKHFLMDRAGRTGGGSRHLPEMIQQEPTFRLASARAIFPTEEECAVNPRSRSARMRVAVRTDRPARDDFPGRPTWGRA